MRLLGIIGFTSFVSSLTSGAATPPVHRPKEEKLPSEVCDFPTSNFLTLATGDRFISSEGPTQELCGTLRNPTINSSTKSNVRVIVKDTSEKRTLSQWCPVDVTTIDELAQYLPNQIGDIDTKQVLNLLTDVAQSSNPKFAYDVLLLLVPFFDDVRVLTNADWLPGKGNETLALVDKASQFQFKS